MKQLNITYLPIKSIYGYHRNARTHSQTQIDALKASITAFGFNNPILIDSKNTIVAGHGRLEAATQLNLEKVPVIKLEHLTDAQRRAYVLADNKISDMGGWDAKMLSLEIADLSSLDVSIDLSAIGITAESIAESIKESNEMMAPPVIEETPIRGLYDDAQFSCEGVYDFPKLRADMILKIPDKISTWAGPDISAGFEPPYMWQWRSDSTVSIDWTKTIVGFYVDDERFECWWENPRIYCERVLEQKIMGAITPNFSTYGDVPRILRLYATYRSRWVGRYMQEAGIRVIPDVDCQVTELEAVCDGIKGIPFISSQAHQRIDAPEIIKQNKVYDYIIDTIKPEAMIVVAREDRIKLFPALKKTRVVRVEPRALLRGNQVRKRKEKLSA